MVSLTAQLCQEAQYDEAPHMNLDLDFMLPDLTDLVTELGEEPADEQVWLSCRLSKPCWGTEADSCSAKEPAAKRLRTEQATTTAPLPSRWPLAAAAELGRLVSSQLA